VIESVNLNLDGKSAQEKARVESHIVHREDISRGKAARFSGFAK